MSVLHQEIRIFVPCNENEIIGKKNHEGQRWGRKKNEVLCFPGIARMLEVLWPMWWSQNRPQTSTVEQHYGRDSSKRINWLWEYWMYRTYSFTPKAVRHPCLCFRECVKSENNCKWLKQRSGSLGVIGISCWLFLSCLLHVVEKVVWSWSQKGNNRELCFRKT